MFTPAYYLGIGPLIVQAAEVKLLNEYGASRSEMT